jgi:hypothetical protein
MNKNEVAVLIERLAQGIPERLTGNEENEILAAHISKLVQTERSAVVELLRDWLAIRIPQSERKPGDGRLEGGMWVALEVAKKCGLNELRSDIEALIADVHSRKTYLPYYEDMIAKYLRALPYLPAGN